MQMQLRSGAEFYLDGLIVECNLGQLDFPFLHPKLLLCLLTGR